MSKECNGWKNYETWNVAMYIGQSEMLQDLARSFKKDKTPYKSFVSALKEVCSNLTTTIDGVPWEHRALDIRALNEMIKEL